MWPSRLIDTVRGSLDTRREYSSALALVLIGIRLLLVMYGTSYIHPDEHLQSAEVMYNYLNGQGTKHLTWEWQVNKYGPIRSLAPVFMSSFVTVLWYGIYGCKLMSMVLRSALIDHEQL